MRARNKYKSNSNIGHKYTTVNNKIIAHDVSNDEMNLLQDVRNTLILAIDVITLSNVMNIISKTQPTITIDNIKECAKIYYRKTETIDYECCLFTDDSFAKISSVLVMIFCDTPDTYYNRHGHTILMQMSINMFYTKVSYDGVHIFNEYVTRRLGLVELLVKKMRTL